jgi:hypothetical protein
VVPRRPRGGRPSSKTEIPRRTTRSKKGKGKAKVIIDEDDNDEDDEGMAEVRAEELWRVENRIKMLQEVADVLRSQK